MGRKHARPGRCGWRTRPQHSERPELTYGDWFTPPQVEQVVSRLALAADSLGYHGIQPLRLFWVFEHARILLALRHDGTCLAFFVENRPGTTAKLDALLEEFTSLPAS